MKKILLAALLITPFVSNARLMVRTTQPMVAGKVTPAHEQAQFESKQVRDPFLQPAAAAAAA